MSNHEVTVARTLSTQSHTFSICTTQNEGTVGILKSEVHTDRSRCFDEMHHREKGADTIMEGAGLTGIKAESKAGGLRKERQKRARYLPDTVPLQLPPCRICGKPASGIHYGVNSCEACKGFFRRSMKRGEAYKCTKGGNCVVGQNQTGLACSGCRLQKCVRLGMSKEGIRQGRYTLQERTSTIMEVRKLKEEEDLTENSKEHQSCKSVKCEAELPPLKDYYRPLLSEPSRSDSGLSGSHYPCTSSSSSSSLLIHQQHSFTEFSQSQTGSLDPNNPSLSSHTNNPSLSSSFGSSLESSSDNHSHHSIPHSSSAGACQNTPAAVERTFPVITGNVSEESVLLYIESLMMGYTEMKPFTKDMSDEEIHALLQDGFTKYNQKIELFGNMDPLPANIYNEIFNMTNMDIDGRTKILEIIRTELVTVIHEYVRFTHGIPAFKELHPNDQASLLKAARLEFFLMLSYRTLDPETGMMISYTGHVLPIRQFCAYAPEDMSTSWLEVSRDIRRLHLHPKEHAAMLAICLTFTDRCSLQNPGAVERIQTDLLEVLQYLLRERYREGCGRQLAKIMDVFVKLRGLNEEFLMVYQKICQDRFLIEQLPELLQFLFDE